MEKFIKHLTKEEAKEIAEFFPEYLSPSSGKFHSFFVTENKGVKIILRDDKKYHPDTGSIYCCQVLEIYPSGTVFRYEESVFEEYPGAYGNVEYGFVSIEKVTEQKIIAYLMERGYEFKKYFI